MKTLPKFILSVLLSVMIVSLVSFKTPDGWVKRGSAPEKYEVGIEKNAGQNKRNAAIIKSIVSNINVRGMNDFVSLGQNINPGKFLGKKIKLTGFIKTKDVVGWSALWVRVDQPTNYSLENMKDRVLKGNCDWTKCEIILNVPMTAKNIAFGGLLNGVGQMWIDGLELEVASNSEKNTGKLEVGYYEYKSPDIQNESPTNLDFVN